MPWGEEEEGGKKRQPGRRVHGEREGNYEVGEGQGSENEKSKLFMTHEEREDVIFDGQIIFIWPPCKHLKACMDHTVYKLAIVFHS